MAHDVFISHSTKDKTISDAICAALEAAGIRCWIAPRDVQPGRSFAGEITRAIQQSKVMVLIFSAHSNNSEQVLREVQLATNSHLHIIQFRIEDVRLNDDLEYFLSTPHWLDALSPPLENHLDRLETSIKSLLGTSEQEPTPTLVMPATPRSVQPRAEPIEKTNTRAAQTDPRRTKTALWIGSGVIAVLLAAGLVFAVMFWKSAENKASQGAAIANADKNPATATKQRPYENGLGMGFVPVAGTNVLFSIWETRVKDYKVFVEATKRDWPKPGFEQTEEHPAVNVSWEDAKAFGEWLTEKERKAGKITASQSYRLPTDLEWSAAVGLKGESGTTPEARSYKVGGVYPWGTTWPPPKGAGNYDSSFKVDDFAQTSPAGSFAANENGIYDLGGNVYEWCEDWWNVEKEYRVLRGAAWYEPNPGALLASMRGPGSATDRTLYSGFRLVVAGPSSAH